MKRNGPNGGHHWEKHEDALAHKEQLAWLQLQARRGFALSADLFRLVCADQEKQEREIRELRARLARVEAQRSAGGGGGGRYDGD